MSRRRVFFSCLPHGAVEASQRDDAHLQVVEYVPAVSATTNTLPGLQLNVQHVVPMWPATLHTMRQVLQPRPVRPISNMPPWWRRQRCYIVLRTITRKAHSDEASTYALAVFMLPTCFSGTTGPVGTPFQVICSSTREVFLCLFLYRYLSPLRPMGLSVLYYQSDVLQRCHPACGHKGFYHLTLSATDAKIKYPIL